MVINNDKRNWPPEARQWWTEERLRKHGRRLEQVEELIHDKETGILIRVERTEGEIKRWINRENWWKGILNKVIVSVLVTSVLAVLGRIGAYLWPLL